MEERKENTVQTTQTPPTVLQDLVVNDRDEHVESLRVGLLLSLSIGILNACTYMTRGHVFASSQSGNLLYLGLDLAQGEFSNATKYLFPPMMFAIGIIIAEHYRDKPNYPQWRKIPFLIEIALIFLATFLPDSWNALANPIFGLCCGLQTIDKPNYPQWRKIPFLIEIALIFLATFLPDSWNALANPIFGLCCGLQTITFRKIRQMPVATIVINSSFQNAIVHAIRYRILKDRTDAFRSLLALIIVLAYFFGIVLGGMLCPILDHWTSLVSAALLLICLFIALPRLDGQKTEANEKPKA